MDAEAPLGVPIVSAIVADFLFPNNFLYSTSLFALGWWRAFYYTLQWQFLGYVDTLHFEREHPLYFERFAAYVGTLLARRVLFWSWRIG